MARPARHRRRTHAIPSSAVERPTPSRRGPRSGSLPLGGGRATGSDELVVVERVIPSQEGCADLDLRGRLLWELALDQRAFGPRRVLVAGADADGHLLELVHTTRTDQPELAFGFCIRTLGAEVEAAVAYCDEPVDLTASGSELDRVVERLADARSFAWDHFGVHLVDWIACDDQCVRSSQILADPDGDPWARR